jgi:leucyl-tRNA synthetase
MFIGAFDLSAAWSSEGVKGCRRFMERVWKLKDTVTDKPGFSAGLEIKMHQTIKKVSLDYESMKYNTAIAAMMSLVNEFYKAGSVTRDEFKTLLLLLNPVAPHVTEELWQQLGEQGRVYQQKWPVYDENKTVEDTVEIAVQINGKVKANLVIALDEKQDSVESKAMELDGIKAAVSGKTVVKVIYVPRKILNIVVK